MKIAAIHCRYLRVKAGAGGAFLDMMQSLKQRGHVIDIYTFGISDKLNEEIRNSFKLTCSGFKPAHIFPFDPYLDIINQLRVSYYFKKLSKQINHNYDLVFIDHGYYSPLILPFLKIAKVYYCYEPPRPYYEPSVGNVNFEQNLYKVLAYPANMVNKYLDRYCVKFADLILCNSDYEREYIYRTYGFSPVTNYLGVDLDRWKRVETGKENLVISVGILDRRKAHDFTIRSIGIIPERKRPKLVIITSGVSPSEEKQRLCNLAEQNCVELEIKDEYIADEEFTLLHSKARLAAIAFIMEPSIEPVAFAFEIPIVAVREAGAREVIIHGKTGLLTNRNEEEFARAIEYLLDNPLEAEKMGKKGKEWLKTNFTWEICGDSLDRNLNNLIKTHKNT